MKRIILAAGLGLGILSFAIASSGTHATIQTSQLKHDTVPQDTTTPAPQPDTTTTK